ncbi:MAG: sterol desaturase family protein [Vicinamibacteria bacterium]|nr:sterol desaturase family protein [Vicinamibacteria bacterium]
MRTGLDAWFQRAFDDDAPAHAGTGWISGTVSVFVGAVVALAALVLRFPDALSAPLFRELYPMPLVRAAIEGLVVLGFGLGVLSLLLRRRKVLGLTGCALAVLASVLGGGEAAAHGAPALGLGLDWFLLNLFLLALVFAPLERLWPLRAAQGPFRDGWTTDGLHFFVSHVLVQALSFLILWPATRLARAVPDGAVVPIVQELPLWAQWALAVLVADLAQYAVHRAFHVVPLLWRFHAIHHSSRALDWLAGSRLHLVDVLATRSLVLAALLSAGFEQRAIEGYLAFVSLHAVLIHSNLRWDFGRLERVLVSPRFHHWHHSDALEAHDHNFAVHLPWIDALFGTRNLPPGQWPASYGVAGEPVAATYLGQLAQPFRRR